MSPNREDLNIAIEPISAEHVEAFRDAVDTVARERRYLGNVEGFPLETTREFVQSLLDGGGVSFVALHNGSLIGWCDVVRRPFAGFEHSGTLGMGVLADYRRIGIGRRLVDAAITAAQDAGITRVELEVYASNTGAIELYRQFNFAEEGLKRGVRILDGQVDDLLCMALIR